MRLSEQVPLGLTLAAVAAQSLRAGRRRLALNEALHELRRPLQALALVAPGGGAAAGPAPATIESTVQLAASALARLEREINGGGGEPVEGRSLPRAPLPARELAVAAVARWRPRARQAGKELALRWEAGEGSVAADRCALGQALDNLIVNAIEHGGDAIALEGRREAGRLRIAVVDRDAGTVGSEVEDRTEELDARGAGAAASARTRRGVLAVRAGRLSGRRRRGHGLRLVARTAAALGGEFRLRRTGAATEAVLDLPLAGETGP